MIERISHFRDIKFGQLMSVYEDGNRMNGLEFYPNKAPSEQIIAAEQDFYQYLKEFFKEPLNFYMVLSYNGQYASALRLEPYKDGLLLEALETKPMFRKKGLAKKLILETLRQLRRDGVSVVYSHISKKNTPSIHLYEKCGFEKHLDFATYIDGSVNDRAYTFCYRIK